MAIFSFQTANHILGSTVFFFFFWGGGGVKFTPAQTNILPEKWWLEASYFKLVPFRGDVNIGGVGV